MPINAYREDLAYIHDAGHGGFAEAAARRLVEELRRRGFGNGVVVDLGCGSGVLAGILSHAGYRIIALDISDAMVAIARERAPEAEFYIRSFVSADLPACIAVTAIGEVLNYAFDERNGTQARESLFRRAYEALAGARRPSDARHCGMRPSRISQQKDVRRGFRLGRIGGEPV